MSRANGGNEYVESLARGLGIIEAFDADHPEMTLSEVARRTGLSPASARRGLHTLAALGYVRQVGKRFLLSARILALGSTYLRAAHVDEAMLPELRRIVGRFGDAASVSILDGMDILYIAHLSEQRATRLTAGIGVTYPAYATSMGRVLLADLSADELDAYFAVAKLEKLTEFTEIDLGRLRTILRDVRQGGFATAVDQLDYGITALAVPITGPGGEVVAALNSSGFSGRVTIDAMVEQRLGELRTSAARIARVLDRHRPLLHSIMRAVDRAPSRPAPYIVTG